MYKIMPLIRNTSGKCAMYILIATSSRKHISILFLFTLSRQSLKFINDYKIICQSNQTSKIFTGEKKKTHLQAPMIGKSHLQSSSRNVYLVRLIKSIIKYSSTPPFHSFLSFYSASNTDI